MASASAWSGVPPSSRTAPTPTPSSLPRVARPTPPAAAHYTRATASLLTLRGLVASSLRKFELAANDAGKLTSLEFQTMVNLTKVEASELAVSAVLAAFRACGLAGYRNDGEFTI